MAFATCLILSLFAQGTASPDLSADQRLRANVELAAPARTLEEVCRQLSQTTGVRIAVAEDVKETLVVVRWRGNPAHSLMDRISSLFDWEWTVEGEGYRLVRSTAAERREKEAYENDVLTPLKALQASVDKAISDAAKPLSDDEQARITELRRALSMPPPAGTTITIEDLEMRRRMQEELMRLSGRTASANLMADLAFRDLTDAQLLAATRGRRIVLSTSPTAAQHRLGDRATQTAERMIRELADTATSGLPPFRPQDVAKVTVAFSLVSPTAVMAPRWILRVVLRDGSVARSFQGELRGEMPNLDAVPVKTTPDASALPERAPDAASVGRALRPEAPRDEPIEPLAAALISIADAAGRNLVGEVADTMAWRAPWIEPGGNSCGEMLDILCPLMRAEWRLEDGVITVRPAPYRMLYRARTIRRSVLREITAALKEKWGMTLDEAARFASLMTDDEWNDALRTTVHASGVTAPGVFGSPEDVYLLRAWHAIAQPQRQRLLAGQTLTVGEVGAQAARELWRLVLAQGEQAPHVIRAMVSPMIQERLNNTFDVTGRWAPIEPTDAFPTGLPASATLTLLHVQEPGVGYRSSIAGMTAHGVIGAHQAGMRAGYGELSGRPDMWAGGDLTPAIHNVYMFGVVVGEATMLSAVESGSTVPGAKAVPEDQLPPNIREQFLRGRGGGGQ